MTLQYPVVFMSEPDETLFKEFLFQNGYASTCKAIFDWNFSFIVL